MTLPLMSDPLWFAVMWLLGYGYGHLFSFIRYQFKNAAR